MLSLCGHVDDKEETTRNRADSKPSRIMAKEENSSLLQLMGSSDVFGISGHNKQGDEPDRGTNHLVSIASKGAVMDDICNDLLTCESRGRAMVEDFTTARLQDKTTEFFALIKVMPKTFTNLYKLMTSNKKQATKLIKADRKLLQRLCNSASSGHSVQMAEVLWHEISPVPLSLATLNGAMKSTAKSQILNVPTTDIGIETP